MRLRLRQVPAVLAGAAAVVIAAGGPLGVFPAARSDHRHDQVSPSDHGGRDRSAPRNGRGR